MAGQLNPNLLLAVPLAPLAGAIIAGMFGFHTRQFFEMETPADRENVQVKF